MKDLKRKIKEYERYPLIRLRIGKAYKYFISNPHLLSDEKNKILFERARTILVDLYSYEQKDSDREGVEKALYMVLSRDAKVHPENAVMDKETEKQLLNIKI